MKEQLLSFLRNIKHIEVHIMYPFIKYKIRKKNFKILNDDTTVRLIKKDNLSISRFGDGEFRWISGIENVSFQKSDVKLAKRLKEVLQSNIDGHAVCIPYSMFSQKEYTTTNAIQWKKLLITYWRIWDPLLKNKPIYLDANFTRPYIDRKLKSIANYKFDNIKEIWRGKRVLVVEGKNTRFGVGNDLLSNTQKVGRIICPSTNAFDVYDEILQQIKRLQTYYDITLIALGPTATILTYDLARSKAIQAIDIGHLDIEYEWFLMQVKHRVPVPGKYVNELKGEKKVTSKLTNENKTIYEKQIKVYI